MIYRLPGTKLCKSLLKGCFLANSSIFNRVCDREILKIDKLSFIEELLSQTHAVKVLRYFRAISVVSVIWDL